MLIGTVPHQCSLGAPALGDSKNKPDRAVSSIGLDLLERTPLCPSAYEMVNDKLEGGCQELRALVSTALSALGDMQGRHGL